MPPGGAPELYRVGDLLVDVTGASVSRHGERIVLPPLTFELLVALVRRHPSTVRRHDLLDTVWRDENVTDQTLSHRVMVLRKALGDHAEEPVYVGGERGFGYRLVAPVERIGPGADEPAAGRRGGRWLVRLAGAATAILAIAAMEGRVAWKGRDPPPRGDLVASAARLDRLCLRGEFFFLSFTEQGLQRSAEAWDQALILAPGHARAHAGRALTTGVRALLDQLSPEEAEPLMRDAHQRALRLDPACPAAHLATSLARLLFDWDAAGAAAAARTATTADPHDLRGPIVLALALQGEGELAQSERVLEAATLDDPYSAAAAFLEGRTHEMQARWDEAVAAYGRALALEPGLATARRGRAECLTAAGKGKQALAALGVVASDSADVLGDPLRPVWRRLCVDGEVSAETVRACVLGGDVERGERLLAAAVAGRLPFVVLAPHEALLQPLRQGLVMRALVVRLQQLPPS